MLKSLKNIGLVVLITLFILSLGTNKCQRDRIGDYATQVSSLQNTNDQLVADINDYSHKIVIRNSRIEKHKTEIKNLKEENKELKAHEGVLEAHIATLSDSLDNIPPERSYAFLDKKAYPYEGKKIYPFNRRQIKEIHFDYLQGKINISLIDNLRAQVGNCELRTTEQDSVIQEQGKQVADLTQITNSQGEIIDNKDKENDLLKKQNKKERRKTITWKVISGVAVGLAVLIAL